LNKWYVDELYNAMILKPLRFTSNVIFYKIIDQGIIDGSIKFLAWIARSIGFFGQLFQSGNIQRYVAIFAAAVAILLYGWLTPGHSRIEQTMPQTPTAARVQEQVE